MSTAHNIEEAMEFFINNSSGSVVCITANDVEKVCETFSEAEEFFRMEGES